MHFTHFPAEILRMILSHLDVKSKLCLWDAFGEFLDAHSWPGLHRVCFVRSRLPARALESRLLRENVRDLDLSCVPNLLRRASALTLLPNLHSLDVSYTDLSLKDAAVVCAACPGITRLTLDYKHCPHDNDIECCASMSNLKYIHLISITNALLRCNRLFDILSNCEHLHELKISALSDEDDPSCSHSYSPRTKRLPIKMFSFRVQFREIEFKYGTLWHMTILKHLKTRRWYTALLEQERNLLFLPDSFGYKPIAVPNLRLQSRIEHSLLRLDVHMWHLDLPTLNPNFCKDIVREVREKLPLSFCKKSCDESIADSKDHFVMGECTLAEVEVGANSEPLGAKHTPLATAKLDLNIHNFIDTERPISVRYNRCKCSQEKMFCNVIVDKNLRVLTLIVALDLGTLKVSSDALKTLMMHCCRLKTFYLLLGAYNYKHFDDVLSMNKSVQNIHITTVDGCYLGMILRALSRCPSVENVIISEAEKLHSTSAELQDYFNFVKNCPHLFSYYYSSKRNVKKNIISHHVEMISAALDKLGRGEVIVKLFGIDDRISCKEMDHFENICYMVNLDSNFLDLKVNEYFNA